MDKVYTITGYAAPQCRIQPWYTKNKLAFQPIEPDTTVVIVTADTEQECDRELAAQIDDGIFENHPVTIAHSYIAGVF